MNIVVQKFGGTSVGTTERMNNVANRVIEEVDRGNHVVVVVSAMGHTTDHLVTLAKELSATPNKREMDMLLSTGEQVSMALLAIALQEKGYQAISMTGWQAGIETENIHSNARITAINTNRVTHALQQQNIVIVAGFQGLTKEQEITTLGRGGSDTTAVALAASLKANRCDIFTDVTGVFTTDPRVVNTAKKLKTISYDEMLELATLGAGVLHPRAVEFAKNYNVCLSVRSSLVKEEGTIVEEEALMENNLVVRGIAFEDDITRITITNMESNHELLALIFTKLAQVGINVDIIIHNLLENGKSSVSFSIKSEDLAFTKETLEGLHESLQFEFIHSESGLAKVSIVGSGMISNPGVAAKMFSSLSEQGISIKMVSTSEIKVSTVIDEARMHDAVRALHATFELENH